MSKKHKSRLETLRDSAPEMLLTLRYVRDILHNALNDDYFDREVFLLLQKRVIDTLEATGAGDYVPKIQEV